MDPIEIVAVVLGLANLVLLIRRSLWNYPAGLAMVTLYALIFWRARLYSDALLQGFFFAAQVYGWAAWARAREQLGDVRVERLTSRGRVIWIGGAVAGALVWGTAMHQLTDAALPYWDALVAIPSVAAQLLLAGRRIENWWLWIAVDVAAIPLYATKGLLLTAGLYAVFLALAIAGLLEWRRRMRVA